MSACELCSSTDGIAAFDVGPHSGETLVALCGICREHLAEPAGAPTNHWFCLRESMWSERAPVKVLAYRILKRLGDAPLAQELLGQIYLDDDLQAWADAVTVDSNGTPLATGDTVTLIKDLEVKGANFTAKRGTTVKGISLTDDPKYVEGKVNGMRIVLVAAYLKKA